VRRTAEVSAYAIEGRLLQKTVPEVDLHDQQLCWMRHCLHFLEALVKSLDKSWRLETAQPTGHAMLAFHETYRITHAVLVPDFCHWTKDHHVMSQDAGLSEKILSIMGDIENGLKLFHKSLSQRSPIDA
jgi:hypothetical protein